MRSLRLLLLLMASAAFSPAATYTWSGAAGDHHYTNPANWVGGVVPPNNGTASIVFGDAQDGTVILPLLLNVADIHFQNTSATSVSFESNLLTVLTIQNGLTSSAGGGVQRIASNITLNLSGAQTVDVSSGRLEISGAMVGNGGLTKTGAGTLALRGPHLAGGDLHVDAGSVIFGSAGSVPSFGEISAEAGTYVGTENSDAAIALIAQIDPPDFRGTIGFDTAPDEAGTTTFADKIDVTRLSNLGGLGSSTSARITGEIKVAQGADYRFGGGSGTLYIESNLTARGHDVELNSAFGQPLTVVLRGNNSFKGAVNVLHSVLVLDSQHAIGSGSHPLNLQGPGYIGSTQNYSTSTAGFLGAFGSIASPNAIVGFDSANINAPRTIAGAIDLSMNGARTDSYYLGTSSKVILTGNITPTVGDSLYLTAVKGGHLIVGSTLGANIPSVVVGQTNSFDPQGGTVELTGANTYTGGTHVLGGTLQVSNNAALGLGGVDVANRATLNLSSNILFSNPFSISAGGRFGGSGVVTTPGGALIGSGAILSPGGHHRVGTLTFNTGLTLSAGAVLEFDIRNLNGSPGTGWDLINVSSGVLNLTATSLSPITLDLTTFNPADSPGLLSGFDASQSYSWLFISADTINGFSSDQFSFLTDDFANSLGGGNFFVSQTSGGLVLNFTPVPEPGTYVLLALGLGVVAVWQLRRQKK